MKKITIILLVLFAEVSMTNAQAPNWLWAKSAGGIYDETAYSVAGDASGNTYITGYFSSHTIIFGSDTLTNAGAENTFLAKYDANGNVLWAKSAGGTYYDEAYSVAVDASGNIYMAGYFGSPTITFGSTTLTNAGSYDIFLAKYAPDGNVIWAKSAGGTNEDEANSVVVDASGNTYIAGHFISVPGITFGSTTLTNKGGSDIFLAKYDANGNVLWAKSAGGNSDDFANSVVADASGNTYVAGYFSSQTIIFGSDTLTNAYYPGSNDIFLVKYDVNGNVLWAKSAGGTADDEAYSVAIDASGNAYMAGYFSSSHITFGSTTLTNTGGENIFLVKYDPTANVLWAKSAVGGNDDEANSVATDASGNVYLAGYFGGSTIIFGADTLTNAGSENIFLAKYDANGNVLWAKSVNGTGSDMAYSVTMGASGNTYLTGYFSSPAITFGSATLTNAGSTDIFLAKLDNATGINELGNSLNISVFPNPAADIVTLNINYANSEDLIINIYNTMGELIRSEILKQNQRQISIGDLSNGLYMITIKSKDLTENQKLIIQR